MSTDLSSLFKEVEIAREDLISSIKGLSTEQVNYKPSKEEWSIVQIVEHLVWAEIGGICGMFKAVEGIKTNQPIWIGESPNQGQSIEEIVDKTWQPKEKVPDIAAPRWGGPSEYWIRSLENCEYLLNDLKEFANSVDPENAIYPHPISGPLNIIQRLEFLRFHMDRHLRQIERVKKHINYPT